MAIIVGSLTGAALGLALMGQLYGVLTCGALATIVTIIAIIKDNKK